MDKEQTTTKENDMEKQEKQVQWVTNLFSHEVNDFMWKTSFNGCFRADPQATESYSSEELKAAGLVGIYRHIDAEETTTTTTTREKE